MNRRPDYIERRIRLAEQRRQADKTHPQPCDCPLHMSAETFSALLERNQARHRRGEPEAPF